MNFIRFSHFTQSRARVSLHSQELTVSLQVGREPPGLEPSLCYEGN